MNHNDSSSSIRRRWVLRYGLAFVAVAAGFGLRAALTAWIGPGLPTYITFYPAVMVSALLAGFGPGLLATALTAMATGYWILPPARQFAIASPVDRVGLVLFTGMGIFMSVVAEFYRRDRRKAAAYDHEMALRESREILRQSEARLASIVGSAMDAIISVDADQRIVLFNAAAEGMFRCSAAEALGQPLDRFIPARYRARHREHVRGFGATGVTARSMTALGALSGLRADGQEFPIEASISQGDVKGQKLFTVILRDITERQWAETALKKANEELECRVAERTSELQAAFRYARSLLEASLDPLVTISPEGKVTDMNQATELVTGVLREQLIGTDFARYFTEPQKAEAGYQKVLTEGQVRDYPLTIRHTSGRTTEVLYHATVYCNEAGEVQGVFAAARDVTERKRMEAELRVASRYARSLIEASLDPLVTISAEGKVTDVNEASVQATGVPRERLIGTDFSNYFTEPDKAREGYRRVFAEGFVRDYPLAIRHASGRITDVLYNATVYHNEAGAVQGVFAAARDITEHKRAEAELARYRDHLEDLVKLRTAELARSNEDLGQFAYVASHDLQEPLRAVGGYVKLLQHRFPEKLDAKAREYVTGAADGAERMQKLIADLLAFSRVGTRGVAFAPADLNALLRDALNNLQTSIKEAGATVTSDPLPSLSVDATQIVQLFQNLIGNAIKFHSDLTPVIHVGARQEKERWLFWVRDNGIGIEPQYAGRIFQIFQRLHTRKQYPGTGIGLAICKKIVERHGGEIRVESESGRGSTFYFSIPEISAKKEHAL